MSCNNGTGSHIEGIGHLVKEMLHLSLPEHTNDRFDKTCVSWTVDEGELQSSRFPIALNAFGESRETEVDGDTALL